MARARNTRREQARAAAKPGGAPAGASAGGGTGGGGAGGGGGGGAGGGGSGGEAGGGGAATDAADAGRALRRAVLAGFIAALVAGAVTAAVETAYGVAHTGGGAGAGTVLAAFGLDLALLLLLAVPWGPLQGLAAHELARLGVDPSRAWSAARRVYSDPAADRARFVARALAASGTVLGVGLALFRFFKWVLGTFHEPVLMAALQAVGALAAVGAAVPAGLLLARALERFLRWWESRGGGPALSRPGSFAVWAALLLPVLGVAAASAAEALENSDLLAAVDARPLVVALVYLGVNAAALGFVPRRLARGPAELPTSASLAFSFVGPLAVALVLLFSLQGVAPARAVWASGSVLGARVGAVLRGFADRDGDGYAAFLGGGDCDDSDPRVHPGGLDIPGNGLDENCNGADAVPGGARAGGAGAAAAPAALPPDLPPDVDVVLVTIDALRADHVGAYGYGRPTTPVIDALAARGERFTRFFANAPSTRFNLPVLHASRPLSLLKFDDTPPWPPALAPDQVTLAETLKAAGVYTMAATNLGYPREKWGIEQGFDAYDNTTVRYNAGGQDGGGNTARFVVDRAIGLLDTAGAGAGARRTFLWVHLYDPHHRYESPAGKPSFGTADMDRYDDEVRNADEELGRLLEHLRATGRAERTVVIVTADHGEAFGEHGKHFHGYDLYDVFLRVPFVAAFPGAAGARTAGRVVELPAETLDVAPTILNLFGVAVPPSMRGRSLAGTLLDTAPAAAPRPLVEEVFYRDGLPEEARKRALTDWPMRLLHFENHDLYELYDVAADPGETHDLAAERPDALAAARAKLAAWEEAEEAPADLDRLAAVVLPRPPAAMAIALDAELGGAVRLLGAAVEPAAPGPGATVKLTLWWQALRPLAKPYRVFVHVAPAEGEGAPVAQGDHEPAGGLYATDRWRPRDVILDEHSFRLPAPGRWPAGVPMAIFVGLYRGAQRLAAVGGSVAAADRVKVLVLPPGR